MTSTPRYPQANGKAESSNKIIINNLKKRLKDAKGKWADHLPYILWSDRTTPKTATGQSPFSLVYGCEAVVPVEIIIPTARYEFQTPEQNKIELSHSLDTIDEVREKARGRMIKYQQQVARSYNKNVRIKAFKIGDWVLRKTFQNTTNPRDGKLAPQWEGPYRITEVVGQGAYRLRSIDEQDVPRSWNAMHLKLYHF